MQTTLELSEQATAALDRLSSEASVSREDLLRTVVQEYLAAQGEDPLQAAFGIWADRNEDGLAYQIRMRSEWDREWDDD